MSEESGRVWIYGIVPAGAELKGLEARDDLPQVWVLEAGDLGAIVGDGPEDDPKATRNQALAHSAVLAAAIDDAPVVPMRFGTMAASDDEVASDLLKDRQEELKALLDRFGGDVELVLKVDYLEEGLLREILSAEPEIAELRKATRGKPEEACYDERVRLGELIGNAIEQRRERDSAELMKALEKVVTEARDEPIEKELMVLNAPLLVPRDGVQDLETAVEQLAQERAEQMHFRLMGPIPAYHFLEAEEPVEA